MSLPDAKALKKLADTCRKVGIKTFKGDGFEFTLSDEVPVSSYKRKKEAAKPESDAKDFESDSISDEALLFWSAVSTDEEAKSS